MLDIAKFVAYNIGRYSPITGGTMTDAQTPGPTPIEQAAFINAILPEGETWEERASALGISLRTLNDWKAGKLPRAMLFLLRNRTVFRRLIEGLETPTN
jgi:hypothetical protein